LEHFVLGILVDNELLRGEVSMKYELKQYMIKQFQAQLTEEEKSEATIRKYVHDVQSFFEYLDEDKKVSKNVVIGYKQFLMETFTPCSVNSMLSALNCFLRWAGWYDCIVKTLKIQKEAFRSGEKELSKEEYYRLLDQAHKNGNIRLYLLIQTIGSTGIRVGELRFITVESLKSGRARVSLKGKTRTVLMPKLLCRKLKIYAKERGIQSGSVFVTARGKPLDRSNICHDMKRLCEKAGVPKEKVFPHNLRHLFACIYYSEEKDLSHLADILGHSNVNTTRIYTMTSEEEQARRIEELGLVV